MEGEREILAIPIVIFRSQTEMVETLSFITNAEQCADYPKTLNEMLRNDEQDIDADYGELELFKWKIETREFYALIFDDDDVDTLTTDDIQALKQLCRQIFAHSPAPVKSVMIVDVDACPQRSENVERHLLQNADDLLAYLNVSDGIARVSDMNELTRSIAPREPRDDPPVRIRMQTGRDPSAFFNTLLQQVLRPVPRRIPAAPTAKRQLPDGYEERLREPQPIPEDNADDAACITCFEHCKSVKLFPCEHMDMCDVCFERLMVSDTCVKVCPQCRGDIESFKSYGKIKRPKK